MPAIYRIVFLLCLFACGSQPQDGSEIATTDTTTTASDSTRSYAEPAAAPSGDTLFSYYNAEEELGYRNQRGDTLVPAGRYPYGFSDTITTYGVVVNAAAEPKLLAIDPAGRELYGVYLYDNGPDYVAEGRFRILRHGKIGYADTLGRIVIPPRFACAGPFEGGRARVALDCRTVKDHPDGEHERTESDAWFFIDRQGNRLPD